MAATGTFLKLIIVSTVNVPLVNPSHFKNDFFCKE